MLVEPLTLREYFAGRALPMTIANQDRRDLTWPESAATEAVRAADALIAKLAEIPAPVAKDRGQG